MKTKIFEHAVFIILIACRIAFGQTIVPVQVSGSLVLAPVSVQGKTLTFLIDSGSAGSTIDSQTALTLDLTAEGKEKIQKNFRDIDADIVKIPEFSISTFTFKNTKLDELNLAPITAALGVRIDGVLGNDILEKMAFRLNYSKKQMVIESPTALQNMGTLIKLRRDHDQFLISTTLVSTPVDLVLDTGTNATSLSWSTWSRVSSTWRPREVVEGIVRAGNPTSPAILVCLPEIRLGDTVMRDQAVRAQTISDEGVFSNEDFGGILGADVLRQFEVGFDLEHARIFLKRDKGYEPDPNRYTTIGIQVGKSSEGSYRIMSVWKRSPAAQAGLQQGDTLIAINGEPVDVFNLEQVLKRLHAKEGTAIELTTERDGQRSKVTVRTRELLCRHYVP